MTFPLRSINKSMSDYQNYIDNLVKQPLAIKMKSLVAEIRKLWEDNRAALDGFKRVEKEIDDWMKNSLG